LAVLATEDFTDASLLGEKPVMLGKGVFRAIVEADTPQGVAAEIAIPAARKADGGTVFLEGVQDPSNVGAVMRSAAAFGMGRVVLDQACAIRGRRARCAPGWVASSRSASPRPGTGRGNRRLQRHRGVHRAARRRWMAGAPLERAMAWIFGAEGRGLSDAIIARADLKVTIP
jgi:TrmH family RNA methyltransferase